MSKKIYVSTGKEDDAYWEHADECIKSNISEYDGSKFTFKGLLKIMIPLIAGIILLALLLR
jgi:hypothetical protein